MSKQAIIPRKLSPGEEAFALHCRADGLDVVREYRFHLERKWRFDFAFPEEKLAVEIEGGLFTAGRHSRGSGMKSDMEKYNMAARLGWRVLRYSTDMVMRGEAIAEVQEVLKEEKCKS